MKFHLIIARSMRGLPGGSVVKNSPANCRRHRRRRFDLWVGRIPWRRKWQPPSSVLTWRIPWIEEPGGLQSMGSQSRTQLSMCTRMHAHLHVHTHTHTIPNTGMHAHLRTHTHTQPLTHACMHTCARAHTHTHTHTQSLTVALIR